MNELTKDEVAFLTALLRRDEKRRNDLRLDQANAAQSQILAMLSERNLILKGLKYEGKDDIVKGISGKVSKEIPPKIFTQLKGIVDVLNSEDKAEVSAEQVSPAQVAEVVKPVPVIPARPTEEAIKKAEQRSVPKPPPIPPRPTKEAGKQSVAQETSVLKPPTILPTPQKAKEKPPVPPKSWIREQKRPKDSAVTVETVGKVASLCVLYAASDAGKDTELYWKWKEWFKNLEKSLLNNPGGIAAKNELQQFFTVLDNLEKDAAFEKEQIKNIRDKVYKAVSEAYANAFAEGAVPDRLPELLVPLAPPLREQIAGSAASSTPLSSVKSSPSLEPATSDHTRDQSASTESTESNEAVEPESMKPKKPTIVGQLKSLFFSREKSSTPASTVQQEDKQQNALVEARKGSRLQERVRNFGERVKNNLGLPTSNKSRKNNSSRKPH